MVGDEDALRLQSSNADGDGPSSDFMNRAQALIERVQVETLVSLYCIYVIALTAKLLTDPMPHDWSPEV